MERIINFTNGKVRVTDPCYDLNVWCAKTLNMLKGKYVMNTEVRDEGAWGKRIGYIKINHIDYKYIEPSSFKCSVGVDSGQCGFFDYDYYAYHHKSEYVDDNAEDIDWYRRVCKITLEEPNYGIIDNMGCVSESGFGDGMYEVYVGYNDKDEIVSAMIVFIYDEDEEEDEWEEEDEEDVQDEEEDEEDADSFTSEDEMIRKHIINLIKDNAESKGIPCDVEIAYLEKQKEIPLMNGDADLYFDNWNQQKINPTKRQCFEEGMKYAQRLQKEQEQWSEEDEDFINMLILHFNYLIDKGGNSVETYKSYREELKSLLERFGQKIK